MAKINKVLVSIQIGVFITLLFHTLLADAETITNRFPNDIYIGPMQSGVTQFAATPNPYLPWSYRFAEQADNDGNYTLAVPHQNGIDYAYAADVSGRGLIQINATTGKNMLYPYFNYDAVVAWQNTTGAIQRLTVAGSFYHVGGSTDGQNVYVQRYNSTLGTQVLYFDFMPDTVASTKAFNMEAIVEPNDYIFFRLNRGTGNDYGDGAELNVTITLIRNRFPNNIYTGPMQGGAIQFAGTSNPYLPWSYRFAEQADNGGNYTLAVPHQNGVDYAYAADVSGRGLIQINATTGKNMLYPYFNYDAVVAWQNTTGAIQRLTVAGSFYHAGGSTDGQNVYVQRYNSTLGTQVLYSDFMPATVASTKVFDTAVIVEPNDYIFFRLNRGPGNDYADGAELNVTIMLIQSNSVNPPPPPFFDANGNFSKTVPYGSASQDYYPEVTEAALIDFGLLKDAGIRWLRTDFTWANIEKTPRVYDFTKYMGVVDELENRGMGAIFILDFNNPLYGDQYFQAITRTEVRDAYANFAAAAASAFKGRRVVFDIWNEPNNISVLGGSGYWQYAAPLPTKITAAGDYTSMANAAITSGRSADANATFIGPSAASFDWEYYLRGCFPGLLGGNISAVSIHPYINLSVLAEFMIKEYQRLSREINAISTTRHIPIMSSEFGTTSYSLTGSRERKHAVMLSRYWLVHYLLGMPSVWYSVKDSGEPPSTNEYDYQGLIRKDGTLKEAYYAAKTFNTYLNGYTCWERVGTVTEDEYMVLFEKDDGAGGKIYRYALWCTSATPTSINLPLGGIGTTGVNLLGTALTPSELSESGTTLTVSLSGEPRYIAPGSVTDAQRRWACVKAEAVENHVESGAAAGTGNAPKITVTVRNVFSYSISGSVTIAPPSGVTGSWQGASTFSLSPGASVGLVWLGSVGSNQEGVRKLDFVVHITGMPDTSAIVWLHAGKPGDVVLAEGKRSETWSTEGVGVLTWLSPIGVQLSYTFSGENTASVLVTLPQTKDLHGYGALEFDIYVPAGGIVGAAKCQVQEGGANGRRWSGNLITWDGIEVSTITTAGWYTCNYDFHDMWLVVGGNSDVNLMRLQEMSKFGIQVGGANQTGTLSVRNIGVRREVDY